MISGQRLLLIDRAFWFSHRLLEKVSFYNPQKNQNSEKILVLKFMGMGSLILFARLCEQHCVDKTKITLLTFYRHREFCDLFGFSSALFIRTSSIQLFMIDCFRVLAEVKNIRASMIIDYERASHAIGTFRNLLALFCKTKTMSFQIGRQKNDSRHIVQDVTKLTYEQIFLKGIFFMDKRGSAIPKHKIAPNSKVLININASDYLLARRYPIKSFAKTLRSIYQWNNQLQFYFTGTLNERNYIDELTKEIPECNVVNSAGEWSLKKLTDEIAHCALFITCDSGPLHIAAYFETPTIAIWGPTQPHHFGYENQKSFYHVSLNMPCSPCFTHPRSKTAAACNGRIDCLTNLDPQQITEVAISLLSDSPIERVTKRFENHTPILKNISTPPLVTSSETI
jgi:ADP-heptose:LPS heptosyltransferase